METSKGLKREQDLVLETEREQIKKRMLKCECGCTFFETIEITRVDSYARVILGQKAPVMTSPVYLYKCVLCAAYVEPFIDRAAGDPLGRIYDELMKLFADNAAAKDENN